MGKILSNACLLTIIFSVFMLCLSDSDSFGGLTIPCGDPTCDNQTVCLSECDGCKWCQDELPGDRCIADFQECGGGPLPCGDPQCDVEDNCLGTLCSGDCKWCPDALPGDRCVADFVECTAVPNQGPVTLVPTLNEWGIMITVLILGLFAVLGLRRRKDPNM